MIVYRNKPEPKPTAEGANRFEQIRKSAQEQHKKSDADAARRQADKKPDDKGLFKDT